MHNFIRYIRIHLKNNNTKIKNKKTHKKTHILLQWLTITLEYSRKATCRVQDANKSINSGKVTQLLKYGW